MSISEHQVTYHVKIMHSKSYHNLFYIMEGKSFSWTLFQCFHQDKGGRVCTPVVHDIWSTMFNQCYKTVFFSINYIIIIIKGGGVNIHYLFNSFVIMTYIYHKLHNTTWSTIWHDIEKFPYHGKTNNYVQQCSLYESDIVLSYVIWSVFLFEIIVYQMTSESYLTICCFTSQNINTKV